MKFIHHGEAGQELAALVLDQAFNKKYVIRLLYSDADKDFLPGEIWLGLIGKALVQARQQEAEEVELRLTETPLSEVVSRELPRMGFRRELDRLEFRVALDSLPSDAATPFRWESLAPAGSWSMRQVADLIRIVTAGDPDGYPDGDCLPELESYLNDPALSKGPQCVNVGLIGSEPVAVAIAQIDPKTKWSRITYMGLAPAHRGRGLGSWIHRHGFEMLRAQGGVIYHGGTTSENFPMLKLFEAHGCPLYRRIQQWKCKF
jgi:GNAT superfamily N-acetyltransferase